jgi:hypothetical protein
MVGLINASGLAPGIFTSGIRDKATRRDPLRGQLSHWCMAGGFDASALPDFGPKPSTTLNQAETP